MFLLFIGVGLFKAWKGSRVIAARNPSSAMLGTCLVACIIGTLLMLANSSFAGGPAMYFYCFGALTAGYAQLVKGELSPPLVPPGRGVGAAQDEVAF